jgi:hypothetical protein
VPVRRREYSEALTVDVSRIVAYRTACGCGWRGPSRATVQRARADYREHEAECAQGRTG